MVILKGISLIFWLLVIPFCVGLLPVYLIEEKKRNLATVYIAGFILELAMFELVCVPIMTMYSYHSFTKLTNFYTVLSFLLAVAGVVFAVAMRKKGKWKPLCSKEIILEGQKEQTWETRIIWILFGLLLLFQLYMAVAYASFDGDDAYFVAHSLATWESDTIYIIAPYTGRSTSLDIRHALAVFPIWISYIARMSNVHPTIIAHTILPLFLIPLTYLLYYLIGKRLFKKEKKLLPMFMTLMALLQLFGNVSIYTTETFFLTRTWQGKSLAGNFIFPAIIWIFLILFDRPKEERGHNPGLWMLLALVNLTAGVSSSLAVLLCAGMTALLGGLMMLRDRKFSILVKAGLACIPNAVYVLLYLFLQL